MPTIDFEAFFDLSSDLLCVLNEDGRLIRTNTSFQRHLGEGSAALNGRDFLSLIHDDDVAATVDRVGGVTPGSASTDFTTRVRDANGGYRQVCWVTSRRPQSRQLFLAGTFTEEQATSGEKQLAGDVVSELTDHISDFVWIREADSGKILYLNGVWEEITGHKIAVGAHFGEFFKSTHPEDVERAKQAGQKANEGSYDQLLRAIDKYGSIRWMRVRTFPVHDADGKLVRVVGVAEDVTELRRIEEALQNSEFRLRSLLECSSDLIMLIDAEGRFRVPESVFHDHAGLSGR